LPKILPTSIYISLSKKQGIKQPCLLHFTPTTGAAKDETLLIHQQSSRQPTGSNDRYATKEGERAQKKKKQENIKRKHPANRTAPHRSLSLFVGTLDQSKNLQEAKLKQKNKKTTKQNEDGHRDCRNLRD
jgi:hypothetical protein